VNNSPLLLEHSSRKLFYSTLNAFRGIACLVVVLFHALSGFSNSQSLNNTLMTLGNIALCFFFMLSGFVNFRPYIVAVIKKERPIVGGAGFLLRRLFRTLPAYWLALTILILLPVDARLANNDYPAYYFLYHIYKYPEAIYSGIFVSWSIVVEVFFWIPLAIISILITRFSFLYGKKFLAFLFLFYSLVVLFSNLYLFNLLKADAHDERQWFNFAQWHRFAIGEIFAISVVYLYIKHKSKVEGFFSKSAKLIYLATIASIIFVLFLGFPDWQKGDSSGLEAYFAQVVMLLPALLLLIVGTLTPLNKSIFFGKRIFQLFGKWSYEIYLFHAVALYFISYLKDGFSFGWLFNIFTIFPLTLLLSVLYAVFCEKFLNKPLGRVIKKYGSSAE
jgi:peptidoglycan/LPS O-acetylase OafA/YrhL